MRPSNNIYAIERLISSASYFTAGMAGFIWLLIATILKKRITNFLMYHIMQSIFISIAYFLFVQLLRLVAVIPLINIVPYLLNMPIKILFGYSILQFLTTSVLAYCIITSFLGLYTYIPKVSEIIGNNSKQ